MTAVMPSEGYSVLPTFLFSYSDSNTAILVRRFWYISFQSAAFFARNIGLETKKRLTPPIVLPRLASGVDITS